MEKQFLPYEQALELKELGFKEECAAHYLDVDDLELKWKIYRNLSINTNDCIQAPTFSQAFRWFREKHGLDNAILKDRFVIETEEDLPNWYYGFKTYEEAELACLNKLIEIVKNK